MFKDFRLGGAGAVDEDGCAVVDSGGWVVGCVALALQAETGQALRHLLRGEGGVGLAVRQA